jgi:hypothetical protein
MPARVERLHAQRRAKLLQIRRQEVQRAGSLDSVHGIAAFDYRVGDRIDRSDRKL